MCRPNAYRLTRPAEMKAIAMALLPGFIAACAEVHAPVIGGAETMVAAKEPQKAGVVNQSYVKSGYEVVHRNGQLLYCRSEPFTGSLFRSTVCRTDAQMQAAEQTRQHLVDQIESAHGGECKIVKCQ
jgi:hypothetical protein